MIKVLRDEVKKGKREVTVKDAEMTDFAEVFTSFWKSAKRFDEIKSIEIDEDCDVVVGQPGVWFCNSLSELKPTLEEKIGNVNVGCIVVSGVLGGKDVTAYYSMSAPMFFTAVGEDGFDANVLLGIQSE